jgi:putative peptidoglycan lipid II flippase
MPGPAGGWDVTDPAPPGTTTQPPSQRLARGIARGATIVAGLTLASRLLGLVRTVVFSQTVGAGCLGTAYVTATQVPNLVYELVLGGALTTAMVPVLARWAERSGSDPEAKAQVSQITSALMTWSVIILVPLTIGVAAAAGPIASLLNPANPHAHCARASVVSTTSSMLVVFAPQIILFGVSVVLFGLLQAYRRFTGPSLAPVVSNVVLIASFLLFVPLGRGYTLVHLPASAQLVLSVGATAGIGVLVLVAVPPTWRLHVKIRPALSFPPGVARRASGLVAVGIVDFIANDLYTLATIALANGRGPTGAIVLFNYAWMVFAALYSVLAVAVTISAFPVLSAREGEEFDRTCAGSTRAVVLLSWLGTAVIAAVSVSAAHVLARGPGQFSQLAGGFAAFAPGLIGIGLVNHLSRVMLAAVALVASWLLAIVASFVLVELVPAHWVVAALALGTTIGQCVVAIPLVIWTRRICGPRAVAGVTHAGFAGLAAALAGSLAGVVVSVALPVSHKALDVGVAVVAAGVAVLVFAGVAYLLDQGDLRVIAVRLRRMAGAGRRSPDEPGGPPGRGDPPPG